MAEGGGRDPGWLNKHLWQIQPVRDILVFAGIFGILYLGYVLRFVTVPILLALTFAYLFEPVVRLITRRLNTSRRVAAGAIIAAVTLTVVIPVSIGAAFAVVEGVGFVERLSENVGRSVRVIRDYPGDEALQPESEEAAGSGSTEAVAEELVAPVDAAEPAPDSELGEEQIDDGGGGLMGLAFLDGWQASVERFHTWIDTDAEPETLRAWRELSGGNWRDLTAFIAALLPGTQVEWVLGLVRQNAESLLRVGVGTGSEAIQTVGAVVERLFGFGMLIFGAFLTAFFFFFFSSGYQGVLDFLANLIPERNKEHTLDLIQKMDRVVAGFIRGRLTIAAIQSVIFAIAYFAIGVPAALLLGVIVGFLSIVPYLASLGLVASIIMLGLEPPEGLRGEWWWIVGAPLVVYFVGQALDDYIWTPLIQGEATGMDTPTVLFAAIAGGILAGFYGLLLAIPVAACIKILLQELFWPRFKDWAEGNADDPLPFGNKKRAEEAAPKE